MWDLWDSWETWRFVEWIKWCPNNKNSKSTISKESNHHAHRAHIFIRHVHFQRNQWLRIKRDHDFCQINSGIWEFCISKFACFVRISIFLFYFLFFAAPFFNWNSICTSNWHFPNLYLPHIKCGRNDPKKKKSQFLSHLLRLVITNCRSSNQCVKIRFVHCYVWNDGKMKIKPKGSTILFRYKIRNWLKV